MKALKRMLTVPLTIAVVLIAIFLAGRYGWKLGGFGACQGAGIEAVEVSGQKHAVGLGRFRLRGHVYSDTRGRGCDAGRCGRDAVYHLFDLWNADRPKSHRKRLGLCTDLRVILERAIGDTKQ